ncbi:MAG: hypothetical protein C5S48_08460 [Candidatus Methanogaster sp.]|nr:MAG: hypothetical protein C5S48_08460 [ANME-2 cluster archaeon]
MERWAIVEFDQLPEDNKKSPIISILVFVAVYASNSTRDIGKEYLFRWDKVSGDGNKKLLRYFRRVHDIGWAESAEIRKSDDDETIGVYMDRKLAEITLCEDKRKAILTFDDGKKHVLKVKKENDGLNIYAGNREYILSELFWLFTLGIFILITCIASLYYTELIWQLDTEKMKYFNLNYKSGLFIITICLCIFYLLSMVSFLRELLENVGHTIPLLSKELLVLYSSIMGVFLGILINVVIYIIDFTHAL